MTIRITDTWIAFKDSDIFWSFKHSPVAILALAVTLLLMISALFAQIIAPFNPYDLASLDLMNAHLPPSWSEGGDSKFWLGTVLRSKKDKLSLNPVIPVVPADRLKLGLTVLTFILKCAMVAAA